MRLKAIAPVLVAMGFIGLTATQGAAQQSCNAYTVQPGDTIYNISRRAFSGDIAYADDIYALNRSVIGPDANILSPGIVIQIYCPSGQQQSGQPPSFNASPQEVGMTEYGASFGVPVPGQEYLVRVTPECVRYVFDINWWDHGSVAFVSELQDIIQQDRSKAYEIAKRYCRTSLHDLQAARVQLGSDIARHR